MKLGDLFNFESVRAFSDSTGEFKKAKVFRDAAPGVVLSRNLTQVDPRIFEKRYPALSFMTSGVEINQDGGYARRIQSLRMRPQGQYKATGDESGNKGRITVAGEDSMLPVLEHEAESIWTESDVEEAALQNISLPNRFMAAKNELYQRTLDEIGYLGIPDYSDSEGLLNYSGFTADPASNTVENLTAQGKFEVIADWINSQRNAVNNTPEYSCNRVDMPVRVYNDLNRTILNSAGGFGTVLAALMQNFPDVEFRSTFRGEDVGGNSVVALYSNQPDVMVFRLPVPLTIGEIIKQGSWDFKVDSKFRTGGLDVLEDSGGYLGTGL